MKTHIRCTAPDCTTLSAPVGGAPPKGDAPPPGRDAKQTNTAPALHRHQTGCRHTPGTRACYVTHRCRCTPCTDANTRYAKTRRRHQLQVEWGTAEPALVDATVAADLIAALYDAGLSRQTIANASGVADSQIHKITHGDVARVRTDTVTALEQVPTADHLTLQHRPDQAHVNAATTWRLINGLLSRGWSKAALGRAITGNPTCQSLQVGRTRVTAATARAVLQLNRADRDGHITPTDYPHKAPS